MGNDITNISGIAGRTAELLKENGFSSLESIANSSIENLAKVRGFSVARAERVIQQANDILSGKSSPAKTMITDISDAKVQNAETKEDSVSVNSESLEENKGKNKDKKKGKEKGAKKGKKKDKKKGAKKGKKKHKKKHKKKDKKK